MIVKRINRKPVMIEMSSADKTIKTRTAQACLCRFKGTYEADFTRTKSRD